MASSSEVKSYLYIRQTEDSPTTRIEGALSLTGRWNRSVSPPRFEISGIIETTEYLDGTYFEIRTGRLIIDNLQIESESFGSLDDNIVFEFTAESYKVLEV